MKNTDTPQSGRRSIRNHLIAATLVICALVAGVGGWAATTNFSGAVIAQGRLVVESDVKKVQHPKGGVVAELLVHEGSVVKAGDVLAKLDDTETKANLAIITKNLDELVARKARLEAEQEGADHVEFEPAFAARSAEPDVARLMSLQERSFGLRKSARDGQKDQLNERIAQLGEQIRGLTAQVDAKKKEIELTATEVDGVRQLWAKNLTSISNLNSLERGIAQTQGELGQLTASIAEARGKIAETKLQILQIDQDLRSAGAKDLADVNAQITQLSERQIAAQQELDRINIRAPRGGIVHGLTVHTVGAVIQAGQLIMLIVPVEDALTVLVRVAPKDIDQVRLDREATITFPSFDRRTTPELNGRVTRIGADLTQDPRTNAVYYDVRIAISDNEITRLGNVQLVPGMPVEAFIQTSQRTVLSYFVKPLQDQMREAFRER